jgi:hypothetical protein
VKHTDLVTILDELTSIIQLENEADQVAIASLGVEPLSEEFLRQCAESKIIELYSQVTVLLKEADGIKFDIGHTDNNRAKHTLYQERTKLRQEATKKIAIIRQINEYLHTGNTKTLEKLLASL